MASQTYNVHLYREMRLFYPGIEATSPEEAAAIACQKETDAAETIEDCQGQNLSALVDLEGDIEYSKSTIIDFDQGTEVPASTTPGNWRLEHHSCFYKIADEQGVTVADIPIQPLDPPEWAKGNAHLMLNAPALRTVLDDLFGSGAQHEHTCDVAEHDADSACLYCQARSILKLLAGDSG